MTLALISVDAIVLFVILLEEICAVVIVESDSALVSIVPPEKEVDVIVPLCRVLAAIFALVMPPSAKEV